MEWSDSRKCRGAAVAMAAAQLPWRDGEGGRASSPAGVASPTDLCERVSSEHAALCARGWRARDRPVTIAWRFAPEVLTDAA